MPVDFLTDEQAQQYGKFTREPTPEQLSRYFHLDDTDRSHIACRRGDHNRLGFALQLCTVRFLGTFLPDPTEVPESVAELVGHPLSLVDASCLPRYLERPPTCLEHTAEIQRLYGYRNFHDQPGHFRLVRWLYLRTWLSAERPSVLFDLATARLVQHKVLLPGASVLARLVASVRDRASARTWRILATIPTEEQKSQLEELLAVPEDMRQSELDHLRKAPVRVNGSALVRALERLDEIRALGMSSVNLERIPENRVKSLARFAAATWAPTIARMPEDRRLATLVAFANVFESTAARGLGAGGERYGALEYYLHARSPGETS